jgi:hypothetical protein
MQTFKSWERVVLGVAVLAACVAVKSISPGVAKAAPQGNAQAYEAKFECMIDTNKPDCSATGDREIPAGKRVKISEIKVRIIAPSRVPIEFFLEVGDPSAEGGMRSIPMPTTQVGSTEGRFFAIYEVSGTPDAFAYRTDKYPAPKFRLSNPKGDPVKLMNGKIEEGTLRGSVVDLQ